MRNTLAASLGAVLVFTLSAAHAAGIEGEYLEARTADVFTGPCISNAEVFTTGDQAVMAWKVTKGTWKGTDLKGLCVAAAVRGTTTFSQDRPDQAQAVVIVDDKATPAQREALVAMSHELGGARLSRVAEVKTARMTLKLEAHATTEADAAHSAHGMPQSPRASFWAANLAQIVTRPLDDGDHFCGNEVVAYSPLSSSVKVSPAYTLGHQFKGEGLDSRWDDPNCRSSFVGRFAL
ncbi:DUF1326 domain-containing protein [Paludisphaera borealis]|uniref:DUF1326 domain-containing protein n=1 Tax=Paludisphaera borealis TaxID=1387353 RepID=A0A1U7CUG5_9BACT|nr:DUF1326 domain-containing protein [Paludisphaera borealis]APW62572.1 hypothetical protein BSF38_04120 [Paludisphaera borealis]